MNKLPDHITIDDKYSPAMNIENQDEANEYFELCVEHTMRVGKKSRAEAEQIEKSNLGYYAGYYDDKTRERVERLFNCSHPYFGKVSDGVPSQDEVLEMGRKLATKS